MLRRHAGPPCRCTPGNANANAAHGAGQQLLARLNTAAVMGAGASTVREEDRRRQQELEEQRRSRRPKVHNTRELRAALRGDEPEIALMQDCTFHLKSEKDVARERADALQGEKDARAEVEKRQRAFASETRPNMRREVTRQLEAAEATAATARELVEELTARDADTGGPLVIDRSVKLINSGGAGGKPRICGGVELDRRMVQRSKLKISVMECRDLPKMDLWGANEVYVCLEVGIEKWKSEVDRSETDNPKWGYVQTTDEETHETQYSHFGESHVFERTCTEGQRTSVRLAVWDEDKASADDLIGENLINLPLNEEEAKRRPTYQEEGFMFPFSRKSALGHRRHLHIVAWHAGERVGAGAAKALLAPHWQSGSILNPVMHSVCVTLAAVLSLPGTRRYRRRPLEV